MTDDRIEAERWRRLLGLLDPVHETAAATARRIAHTSDEGDDLYQDAVLHAFRKLDSLRDESRFRSWFFAILLSQHRTRARRAFWRRFLPMEDAARAGAEPAIHPVHGEEDRLRSGRLRSALASLSPGEREALVLHEMQGFSTEEIAEVQGVAPSSVRSRLTRARRHLAGVYVQRGWVDAKEGAPGPTNAIPMGGSS
jgi:RNA polymerase sigma-70 factor (ECF subfamily)